MLNIVVCIKQVPMVTELPWDEKTGTLRRDLAAGMMNPACKRAVEAALQIKEKQDAFITVITMGPPVAEEVLREALAMGADRGILICDRILAGSDTYATSFILAEAIKKEVPDCDLILCGAYTSDSETAQVGPQLAEELNVPAAAYAENLDISGRTLRVRRLVDNFRETLEMEFPALVTISMEQYEPRYASFAGLNKAFMETRHFCSECGCSGDNSRKSRSARITHQGAQSLYPQSAKGKCDDHGRGGQCRRRISG